MLLQLPTRFHDTISTFSFAFRKDVWPKVIVLLIGSIICPGSRTVCNVLRSVGLQLDKNFPKYHRLLSTDKWSAERLSRKLLDMLLDAFVGSDEAIVFGLDDTIERRWGPKISKRAIYRDPVRSSKSHFVKCSGLRWLSLMLLTPLPWLAKGVVWALPVLTMICPSERYYTQRKLRIKKLTDWAAQLLYWIGRRCRGLGRRVYLVGDGSFATLELFMLAQQLNIGMIARLKLNARLYELPPEHYPQARRGPKPPVGQRLTAMEQIIDDPKTKWTEVEFTEWYGQKNKSMKLSSGVAIWRKSNTLLVKIRWVLIIDPDGKLQPTLLGSTEWELIACKIVVFFVRRWRVEVTFEEVRRHLGVETQRQWSDMAIERTTPSLMALFSITCLLATQLHQQHKLKPKQTAWYKKEYLTFSDVLAAVRMEIWQKTKFFTSNKIRLFNNYSSKIKHLWFLVTQAAA